MSKESDLTQYKWIKDYCLSKNQAELESKLDWGADIFKIKGKWFVMAHQDKKGQAIISLKCDPYLAQELRSEYPGKIIAGYHFNKSHWNSIYLESDLPVEVIKKQIDHSYDLVVKKLPKVIRDSLV